ncbi:hypothetical protein BC829DRAFT_379156 [Chytridium lagenaria]|nr:hypothetical protein BC829DRAFT_379156 [Chytridium lagenaria]
MLQTTAQNGSIDQAAVEAESRALPGNVINNIEYKLKSTGISAAMLGAVGDDLRSVYWEKSLKRVKGVNSAVLIESIKVYLMSMLQAVGRSDLVDPDALVAQATVLKDNLNEPFLGVLDKPTAIAHSEMVDKLLSLNSSTPILKLPAPTSVETIDPIDEEIGVVGHPVQCLVTLETALSVLADLDETPTSEKDLHPWMELILQLCMVRLVDIVFPAHPITGLPDFADAWSARINTLSRASVLSAASAAHLRNEIGDMDTFKCPITGAPHSSALILSHPNDPVLSRAYKSLTYLPSLYGVIHLVVFPSLGAGVQASTLMHLLQPGKGFTWTHENGVKASKATWEVVRCVLASLRDSGPVPAFSVVKGLKEDGMLNPADSVAKIVVGCLGYVWRDGGDVEGTLKLVAKELAGNAVASFKKWVGGVEGVEKEEVQKRFIGDDAIAKMFVGEEDEGYDPLKALHPVEVFLGKSLDGKELIEKLVPLVKETRLFEEVLRLVRVLGMIMRVDVREGEPEKAFEMRVEEDGCSEEDVAKVVAEAAVLGSRTGWYENAAKAGALRAVWKRREDVDDAMVRDEFSGDLKVWTGTMVNDVDAWTGVEDVELKLMGMKVEVFGKTHKLQRMDAVEVVQMMDERLLGTVGVAMCIGTKWTRILKSMKRMTEAYNRVSDMDLDDETSKKCFELFAKCQELQTMKRLTKEMKKILPDFYV